jgi:hypothetical protein
MVQQNVSSLFGIFPAASELVSMPHASMQPLTHGFPVNIGPFTTVTNQVTGNQGRTVVSFKVPECSLIDSYQVAALF